SDADGRRRCPFSSKNERNPSRSSADVRIATVYEAGAPVSRVRRGGSALGGAPVRVDLLGGDLVADLLERAPDQPRDVHLRDPDLLSDLRLRQALEEAQVQDPALALVECAEPRREHGTVLRNLVLVLDLAQRLE